MGIDFGTNPCGRHFINGVYGQVLKEGIFVDQVFMNPSLLFSSSHIALHFSAMILEE